MFTNNKKVVWGMSEKEDGQMFFSPTSDSRGLNNQTKFFNSLNMIGWPVARVFRCHGNQIEVVSKQNISEGPFKDKDGLITKEKELVLSITVGDCLPIYFSDQEKKVIGIAHAGWKGVLSNIVGEMIDKMTSSLFYSDPRDIVIHIGPHIHSCHFIIKDDVLKEFLPYKNFIKSHNDGTYSVDLAGIVKSQLLAKKLFERNINVDNACTFCAKDRYFSFRRDKKDPPEVMVAFIALKN